MSVLDSIDTTVTLEWPGRRTIGTLVEIDGYTAIITALNAPTDGVSITVTVEGDTADEAIAIDGICLDVSETAWGEQRIEMELMRVGTTCSATRLRDFIEEYGVSSGGSVHIGASRAQPGKRRFVYHVPERVGHVDTALTAAGTVAAGPDLRSTFAQGAPGVAAASDLVDGDRNDRQRSPTQTNRNVGRPAAASARTGETLPAGSATFSMTGGGELRAPTSNLGGELASGEVWRGTAGEGHVAGRPDAWPADGAVGFSEEDIEEMSIGTIPDKTINTDLAGGAFATGGSLDEAFREALRAVDRPKMPDIKPEVSRRRSSLVRSSPDIAMDAVPMDSELGRPVLPLDELEPTRMMAAMPDDDGPLDVPKPTGNFTETDLSVDDVTRLKAAIDDAIAHEREVADSAHHDPDEPIVVNTVARMVPFAEPVQLGNDNRAPTMAQVAPAEVAAPAEDVEAAAAPPPSRTSTARIERVAPSLAGALIAPKARKSGAAAKPRKASGSLERIQTLFNVDMAIRCDLPATFQIGRKKKYKGQLIRLAESRLRVQSTDRTPHLYQRIKVLLTPVDGGKHPITLQCEVMRIRDAQDDTGMVAFDVHLSAGTNPPKEMNALRALMRSFEAPSARPVEASA